MKTAIIGAIVMVLAGGTIGYQLGGRSGAAARKQLAVIEEQGEKGAEAHRQVVKDLKAELEQNRKKFEAEREKQAALFEKQRKDLEAALAEQAGVLREMERKKLGLEKERNRLQALLAGSVSPKEKETYLARIAALDAQISDLLHASLPSVCTSTPVPKKLLDGLRGG